LAFLPEVPFTSSAASYSPFLFSIVRYCSYCRASGRWLCTKGSSLLLAFINFITLLHLLSALPVPLARRYPDCWPAIHPYATTPAFPIICNDLYVFEMALLSAEHLAGPGYIILNVMRGLNIVALASVVASSIVMLVKTFVVSKVSLQDVVSQLEANTR
jgi:hypothetical protein